MWWFLVIAFNVILLSFVTSSRIDESTVELRDNDHKFISYGFIVSENAVIIPAYNRSNEIKLINFYKKSGLMLHDVFDLPAGSSKMINDAIVIFTTINNNHFHPNSVTRINRCPFYGHDQYYTALLPKSTNIITTSFKLFSDEKCGEIVSKFNASTQVCVQNTYLESKSPLIANSEDSDYIVGFANEEAVPNATIFNLINQKSYNFPIYDRCDSEKEFPSHFALCNSFEISENLKDSCHSEIILVGNIEVGNNKSFIPIEFGIVVSDDQILVSSKINQSLENYQIYGNGKMLKVALMLDNIVIEEDNFISNITTKNGKQFHILKYNHRIFKDLPKANFIFDENFKTVNGNPNIDNFSTFKFVDQKLVVQSKANNESDEISALNPLFCNDKIIGFREDNIYFSAYELKEFLQHYVPNLQHETFLSTPKIITEVTTLSTKTITEFRNVTDSNYTVTSSDPVDSSSNKLLLALWPLFMALFHFHFLF